MTVTTTGLPEQYLANGVTTIFDFHSRVLLTTDMVVFVNNVQQFAGYTVTLLGGGNSGARVTFSVPPANGLVVELSNEPPPTQLIDYTENTAFPANVQEFGLDKLTLLFQGIRNFITRSLRRALRVPIFESGINELPSVAVRAGKFLVFDAFGQPQVASIVVGTSGISLTALSIASLKAINVALLTNGVQCAVSSYYGIGGASSQFGGGIFRYNSASVAAEDGGTIFQPNVGSGRWERMFDGNVYNTWFGTVGDLVTDDTLAMQKFWDYLVNTGRAGIGVKGNYLVGPQFGNGSAWVAGGKVIPSGSPLAAIRVFTAQGRVPFGFRLVAKPGAYTPTDAVFAMFNGFFCRFEGLSVDMNNVAQRGIHCEFFGPDNALANTFRDWCVEGAPPGSGPVIDISGMAADAVCSNFNVRSGTPLIGLKCSVPGGAFHLDDMYIYVGRVELAAQNATINKFVFARGIKVTDDSYQVFKLHGGQMSQDNAVSTGWSIYTNIGPGEAIISSMKISNVLFLHAAAPVALFAGRWYSGAQIENCVVIGNTPFVDTANFTPLGSGLPNFDWSYSRFESGQPDPVDAPGFYTVSTWQNLSSAGIVSARRRFGTSVRIGDGDISPGVLDATGSGLRLRAQTQGALTADQFGGFNYNRDGVNGATEMIIRYGVGSPALFRMTGWDGATAAVYLTMNTAAGEGLYASPTNTWKLGRAGNVFTEVFATNPVINPSDGTMKTAPSVLSAKELAAGSAMLDNIISFQWNDAVDAKGGKDKARFHVGLIAQDVKAVFAKNGIAAERYGLYCYDEWDNETVETPAVLDEDGKIITPAQKQVIREAGKQHGLRTAEAMMLMLASLNARVKKLEN